MSSAATSFFSCDTRQLWLFDPVRTALIKDGKAYVQAGGGWVNDSEPEAEFQETVNKSKAMLKALSFGGEFCQDVKAQIKPTSFISEKRNGSLQYALH